MAKTTIVIVDDHAIVREGVTALLRDEPSVEVVGESSEPVAAVSLINRLRPDVFLLDLVLRDRHGLEILRKVRHKTRAIILSMRADDVFVAEALAEGAVGYLLKEATSAELLQAIKQVSEGGTYLSAGLNRTRIETLIKGSKARLPDPYTTLTARERTILPLAAEGLTSAQIGERLSISARTVEVHRARLMKKLKLQSQTELIRYAARRKLVVL
jgi:DNA-binding NarL/FixJ family response regulator